MIADRIVIENNEIIFRLEIETVGANAAEIAIRAKDEAIEAAAQTSADALKTGEDRIAVELAKEQSDFSTINNISIPYGSTPVITRTSGDEARIREIGNVVFDNNINEYIFTYTGTRSSYVEDQCWIYWATSPDLKTWTKRGKCTGQGAEDPYLVIEGNTYYLFVEHKDLEHPSAHAGVGLWKGDSMTSLTFQGVVLEQSETGWDSGDVSSPTLIFDGIWYMFYEGRQWPIDNQRGAIGYAASSSLDGPWMKMTESSPLIAGTQIDPDSPVQWAYSLVPDDIIKSGSKYYLSFHAESNGPYTTSILMSDNLTSGWVDPIGQWFTKDLSGQDVNGAGFMLVQHEGRVMTMSNQGSGVYVAELTNKSTGNWYYRSVSASFTDSALHSIAGGNRNEIIYFNLTSDRVVGWRSNKDGKAGVVKKIVNRTDFSLTIQPELGVRINNLATGYQIKPHTTVDFVLTAVDRWDVLFEYKESLTKSIQFGNDISGSITLSEADNSILREITTTGTITVPSGLSIGWNIELVNISSGDVTITASGTLRNGAANKLKPGKGCVIYHRGGNIIQAIGLES